MLDVDENQARKWLDLTQQEYDIVKSIYRIENRGLKPSPKNIQRQYFLSNQRHLLKPNLFKILQRLKRKNVISKRAHGIYTVDRDGMRATMDSKRRELEEERKDFEETYNRIEDFLKSVAYRMEEPGIDYLEGQAFYDALEEAVNESKVFYVVSSFPIIAYTREMTDALGREGYADALWKKCLKSGKTKVRYLTDLNTDYLFNHCFRAYSDPKIAYNEAANVFDRLKNQVKVHNSLEVRYMGDPIGLDVAIAEYDKPYMFIIFTRDEHRDIHGGVQIRSRDTASSALQTFQRSFQYATDLRTKQGQQQLQQIKDSLIKKYGILEE